jgi:23S rRNA pseudouridine1911/1915/1917 synthase
MALTRKEFVVRQDQSEMRIDLFLASMLPDLSRRKVRQILDVGGCYVNNKRLHIASRQVRSGDKVRVEFSIESLQKSRRKSFELAASDIIFDQYNVIAINKPPGLPSQATRDQDVMHAEVCVREWLKKQSRGQEKLILLHRLDKETSGVLLFATNANTATWITDQFRQRSLSKTYWAICRGLPKLKRFEQECYLSEIDKKTGKVSAVRSGGKPSRTTFEERLGRKDLGVSWIVCHPETGRSHQIRVHLEMLGLPILGDKKYGQGLAIRVPEVFSEMSSLHHMLHARSLEFSPAPGMDAVTVSAEPPQNFKQIIERLEGNQSPNGS